MPPHKSTIATARMRRVSGAKLQPVATCAKVFVIADLHLGDEATCAKNRRAFGSAADMGEEIVRCWNDIVRPEDIVYILGDLGRGKHIEIIEQLKGKKHLVVGNADDLVSVTSSKMFASVAVARWLPGFLLTHIPVHPSQLRGRTINVHGHLHAARINDPRYRCVSVEQIDFTPIRLDSLSPPTVKPTQGKHI